ncbi:MAG: formate dehydrogenase accessory sulfurtransferase FdhD [Bacillota bacterium]|nr:formate dehydrogenase accessory sulfurtransferase FdhD [Bacillota bacterium]
MKTSDSIEVKYITRDGEVTNKPYTAMGEALLEISVNGNVEGTVPCTPEHLEELVAGWLCYKGLADKSSEITDIDIRQANESGSHLAADTAVAAHGKQVMKTRGNIHAIGWDWLYGLDGYFEKERPLRQETKATHSCILAVPEEKGYKVLFHSEDAGRHSAIDKAVGWGILHDIELGACVLYTSGRVSETMVEKAVASGVMALATGKPLVSTGAVEAAAQGGLMLAGIDRSGTILIFA